MKEVEDLSCTLAVANDCNLVGCLMILENLLRNVGELRGVNDFRVVLRERRSDVWPSTCSDDDVPGSPCLDLIRQMVLRDDFKDRNVTAARPLRVDCDDLLGVRNNLLKPACAPLHVILILDTCGKESVQVGELNQAVLLVQVVDECELAAGIPHGCHVFHERDLHLCTGQKHAGMPRELLLLLQKGDLRCSTLQPWDIYK